MISTLKNLSGLHSASPRNFLQKACSFGHHHVREGMEFHPSLLHTIHMEKGKAFPRATDGSEQSMIIMFMRRLCYQCCRF